MKNTNWVGRLVYTVILIGYIIGSNEVLSTVYKRAQATFKPLPFIAWSIVIFIVFGLLLGIDYLFEEIKKEGAWKINICKLLFIGLPCIYYALSLFTMWFNIECLQFLVIHSVIENLVNSLLANTVIEILLGYTLITSFYKVSADKFD